MTADQQVRVVPYDPAWPARYELERSALESAIGDRIHGGVHHVGSTSVPGLEAKPTIDILVGVHDLESSRACFAPLAALEYQYAPYRVHEMHWFCKPDAQRRSHHLHLVPAGSRRFREEFAFRDCLRRDDATAAAYSALKRDLATRFRDDREAYTSAKADFIRAVLERAQPLT